MSPAATPTPDDELDPVLEGLLDSAAPAPARAAFRARLQEQFVTGRIDATDTEAAPPQRRWRAPWIVGLALAAALLVAVRVAWPTGGSRLELLDGSQLPLAAASFESGQEFETRADTLRVRIDERVVVEFGPQTRARVVQLPDADTAGQYVFEVASGALRVATGPGFAPNRLRVTAPDAEIEIVGTRFGVDVFQDLGTCVCCTQGTIAVRPHDAQPHPVPAGGMAWCPSDDEPMYGDAKPDHAAPVEALARYW